jgi:hypothetical protein
MLRQLLLAVSAASLAAAITPDADQIVRKSVETIQADWAQAPKFSYLERDVESKRHSPRTAKTYRVLMIDGSPYNLVTAINDQPLSADEQAAEQRKLQKEIERRRKESDRERARRIAKYDKERGHEHEMLEEMVNAFQFHLTGEAQVNGRSCWVLDAEPKPGYAAPDHESRVLKGMQGMLWIDKATNQWVRVHAAVVKPVSFYGFLAKVGPGTEFDLEQAQVSDNIWMPIRFDVQVHSTALGFFNEDSTDSETYRDYQLMPQALALIQSSK